MINTLEKIGSIIKNDSIGRVKYHPLIREFNSFQKTTYHYYDIDVDTINDTLTYNNIDGNILEVPLFDIQVLKYDTGGNNYPYLIGNYEYINNGKVKTTSQNILSLCMNNIKNKGITNKLILDFSSIINSNIVMLDSLVSSIPLKEGIIIKFTINGKEFFEYRDILDEIDKIYCNDMCSTNDNGNLILKNSLYGFYNANKIISQSPNFSFNDSYKSLKIDLAKFSNLIYGVKFHENNIKPLIGNYNFIYLPNFDGLQYHHLDDLYERFENQKMANVNFSKQSAKMKKLNNIIPYDFIKDIFAHGFDIEPEIKSHVKFDIIFKLKGGQTTNDVLYLRNYNISVIEKLNDKIEHIKKVLSTNNHRCNLNIVWAFKQFFKFEGQTDSVGYNSFIFNWIVEFFQNKYHTNLLLDNVFIKKAEYIIRNEEEISKKYSYLLTNYKFLKFMETNGEKMEQKLMQSQSYLLGKAVGKYCSTWQEDRKNLKSYVQNFNGYISRNIKTLNDVQNYFNNITVRLERNKCKIYSDRYSDIYNNFNETFDVTFFIKGYFEEQYGYKSKNLN